MFPPTRTYAYCFALQPPLDYDVLDGPEEIMDAVSEVASRMFPDVAGVETPPMPASAAEDSLFVTERR